MMLTTKCSCPSTCAHIYGRQPKSFWDTGAYAWKSEQILLTMHGMHLLLIIIIHTLYLCFTEWQAIYYNPGEIVELRTSISMYQHFQQMAIATSTAKAKLKTMYGLEEQCTPFMKLSVDLYQSVFFAYVMMFCIHAHLHVQVDYSWDSTHHPSGSL